MLRLVRLAETRFASYRRRSKTVGLWNNYLHRCSWLTRPGLNLTYSRRGYNNDPWKHRSGLSTRIMTVEIFQQRSWFIHDIRGRLYWNPMIEFVSCNKRDGYRPYRFVDPRSVASRLVAGDFGRTIGRAWNRRCVRAHSLRAVQQRENVCKSTWYVFASERTRDFWEDSITAKKHA